MYLHLSPRYHHFLQDLVVHALLQLLQLAVVLLADVGADPLHHLVKGLGVALGVVILEGLVHGLADLLARAELFLIKGVRAPFRLHGGNGQQAFFVFGIQRFRAFFPPL